MHNPSFFVMWNESHIHNLLKNIESVVELNVNAINYSFDQTFNVAASKAFEWCTDFSPEDLALMKDQKATRVVHQIAKEMILLIDTHLTEEKSVLEKRLVCLYPHRLMWTATHLTGPNKYSQFLYEITPKTQGTCNLKFTGLFLYRKIKEITQHEEDILRRELKEVDSENWKLLAGKMEKDLSEK